MAECIKANRCQNFLRHCHHQFRINNRCFGNHRIIPQRLFILRLIICQHCKTVSFTSGSAGRRYKNQRQCSFTSLFSINIIKYFSFIYCCKCDGFRTVHNTSTTQTKYCLTAIFTCNLCSFFCRRCKRIWFHLVKQQMLQAFCLQQFFYTIQ